MTQRAVHSDGRALRHFLASAEVNCGLKLLIVPSPHQPFASSSLPRAPRPSSTAVTRLLPLADLFICKMWPKELSPSRLSTGSKSGDELHRAGRAGRQGKPSAAPPARLAGGVYLVSLNA